MVLPGTDRKFRGKVLSLHSTVDSSDLTYRLTAEMKRTREASYFTDRYLNPFQLGQTPDKLGRNFKDHANEMAKKLPCFYELPRHGYEPVSDDDPHGHKRFTVSLPPYSYVISTDPGFFPSIGLATYEKRPGRANSDDPEAPLRELTGFFNDTETTTVHHGSSFSGNEDMQVSYQVMVGSYPPTGSQKVESGWYPIKRPLELPGARGTDLQTVTESMSKLISAAHRVFRLTEGFLRVTREEDNVLELRAAGDEWWGRAAEGHSMAIEFDPGLAYFLQLDSPTMTFPLSQYQEQKLTPRKTGEDPLEDVYPLTLATVGGGPAKHYVDGLGYISILSHMHDKLSYHGAGLDFESGVQHLTVYFLNRESKRVRFERGMHFFLTMAFEPLIGL